MTTTWDELQRWQTVIGASVGFVALVAGALINYGLGRRRDRLVREAEANSVAAALYAEILPIREDVARLANMTVLEDERRVWGGAVSVNKLKPFGPEFRSENEVSSPELYEALSSKLGLLPAPWVLVITRFHQDVGKARKWVPFLESDGVRPYQFSIVSVLQPAVDAVSNIEPTLKAMEAKLGMPSSMETRWKLDRVLDAIEQHDLSRQQSQE